MGEKQDGAKKNNEGEKKSDGGVTTVVLKVDLHCEGCAKKIKHSLRKHFDGVETVKADIGSTKLTVVGKVDPAKIKDKVEQKIKKKVELISPQPNKEDGEKKVNENKPDENKSQGKSHANKSEENKDKPKEPQVSTVVLKTRVHCEGCAQKIRKIVGKREGVKDVDVDLQKDTITIKGTMNMKELLPYLNVKLKRIVELAPPKKDEGDKKPKEGGVGGGPAEKPKEGGAGGVLEKPKEGGGGGHEKPKQGGGDKKEGGGDKKKEGKGGEKKAAATGGDEASIPQENTTRFEINKMEYGGYPYGGYEYGHGYGQGYGYGYNYTYDPRQYGEGSSSHQVVQYWHEPGDSDAPQMFSDENPNACSVM